MRTASRIYAHEAFTRDTGTNNITASRSFDNMTILKWAVIQKREQTAHDIKPRLIGIPGEMEP
jgi:hypothetical protein